MHQVLMIIKQNSERCSLFLFVPLVFVFGLSACGPETPKEQQLVFSGPMMGTEYRVTLIKHQEASEPQLEAAILGAMNSVNQSMSNYIEDSEINTFNRLAANQSLQLSPDFLEVMQEALNISILSDGAFDVTLAKAINAWGFGPDGEITQQPNIEQLRNLREIVGYQKLSLGDDLLSKTVDGVELNLSAIAKGYAVDKVALALDSLGIQEVAMLDNVAIATSGDYRNYLVIDGEQFSHTIDSQTLKPVFHKLALVSVISPRASTADALATAMMAMDEKRAWAFAENNDLAAYLVVRGSNDSEFTVRSTEKFSAYLQ